MDGRGLVIEYFSIVKGFVGIVIVVFKMGDGVIRVIRVCKFFVGLFLICVLRIVLSRRFFLVM